jgi:hypothetical protein
LLGSAERSEDLRAYYAKHTKSERLDSVLLARLPLLHPEGPHHEHGLGPGGPSRRATKVHSTLVKRRVGHRLSLLVWSTPKTHELWSVPFPAVLANELVALMSGSCSSAITAAPRSNRSRGDPSNASAPDDESGGLVVELFAVRHRKVQGLVLLNPTEMLTESRLGQYLLPVLGVAQILASGLAIKLGVVCTRACQLSAN